MARRCGNCIHKNVCELYDIVQDPTHAVGCGNFLDTADVVPRRDTYYFEEGKPPVLIETSENRRSKIAREIFEEIEREIVAALRSNYSAKQERVEKQIPDDFVSYMCEGKIAALLGIDDSIAELKKKYTEGEE